MPVLEGFWIKNYRILRQVAVGSCYLQFVYVDEEPEQLKYELSPTTLFIGKNGTGKSTLLDSFSLVADILEFGLEDACDKRGGFDSIYSQGGSGPISLGYNFRLTPNSKVLTYVINIVQGANNNRPYIETELLAYRADNPETFITPILYFQNSDKIVRHLMTTGKISEDMSRIERTDMRHLGIARLGEQKEYRVVGQVKNFFQEIHYVNKASEDMRNFEVMQTATHQTKIRSPRGEGLMSLLKHFQIEYPGNYQAVLDNIAKKFPGIESLNMEKLRAKLMLTVKRQEFPIAFYIQQMSDGFIKLLIYHLLMDEPSPAPLIAIEGPEEGLDYRSLKLFIKSLKESTDSLAPTQIFLTSHYPGLADMFDPSLVWVLEKHSDGFSHAQRGNDYPVVRDMIKNGQPFGELWYSDYLDQIWRDIINK